MEKIETIKKQALDEIAGASSLNELEALRITYLSKKGVIASLMQEMKNFSNEDKPKFGQLVNVLKNEVTNQIEEKNTILKQAELNQKLLASKVDITLDGYTPIIGNLHPINMITRKIEDIFLGLGYQIEYGPEVELDLYNFERANTPKDHPARDMQDTFYISENTLLRTHTTAIQTRVLEACKEQMPIKLICPGKVYRRDDDDQTHSHQFNQLEGIVVGEDVSLASLKGTLEYMLSNVFEKDIKVRFRPSYFPFTEPSYEVDMSCHICQGKGCSTCKGSGWIEILGCGMVHPNVLKMAGIDSEKYQGFAFGVGLERLAMIKYQIKDIRDLYNNDLRFLKSFDHND